MNPQSSDSVLLIQLVIRNEADNTYYMGLSPQTDKAIWTVSRNAAARLTEDTFANLCAKLRGRGYAIQGEVFSHEEKITPVAALPTQASLF